MTTPTSDDHPHVIGLPPLMLAGSLGLGVLFEWLLPLPLPLPAWTWVPGVVLIVLAIVVATWARRIQTSAGTNVNPHKPTTAIVTSGPYGFTRNPMYVALALVHLGLAVWTHAGWLLIMLVPFLALIHWGVVLREERYLDGKFGETYRQYRARVRRYI